MKGKDSQPLWADKLPRHSKPIPHIKWGDLEANMPKPLFKKFGKWMRGQTSLLCDDGQLGVYTWDFDRWIR